MRRLQMNFSRDLQNTLNLLDQSDISSPNTSYQQFTHHKNPEKKSPIQIEISAQNNSKPKQKPKTKTRTKQNSPKRITKRKVPTKKHQKKNSDQISFNSILENPITSADPNIKKMFTLFHLERTYRQKKIENMYNFYFYFWFKKLTRKLLKLRLDQHKSQSVIQSSSIIHITTATADELTQTEFISEESDIFNFSNDDVQDFPDAIQSLSDTQLIDKVITGTSIYNNDIDYDEDDGSFTKKNECNQRRIKDDDEQNLIENSFITWKSEQISNKIIDKACNLVPTIIEKSTESKNSRRSNDIYNNNFVESKANNRLDQIDKYYDNDCNSKNDFIDFNYANYSENNENSFDEFNSTKRFNEYNLNENENENENENDFLASEIRSKIYGSNNEY